MKMTVSEGRNVDVQWQAGNTAVFLDVCGFYTYLDSSQLLKGGKKIFFSLSF